MSFVMNGFSENFGFGFSPMVAYSAGVILKRDAR